MIRVPTALGMTWACTFPVTMVRVAALIESASSFMGVIRCEGLSLGKAKHGAAPLRGPRDELRVRNGVVLRDSPLRRLRSE
jgi:hypothetical protein